MHPPGTNYHGSSFDKHESNAGLGTPPAAAVGHAHPHIENRGRAPNKFKTPPLRVCRSCSVTVVDARPAGAANAMSLELCESVGKARASKQAGVLTCWQPSLYYGRDKPWRETQDTTSPLCVRLRPQHANLCCLPGRHETAHLEKSIAKAHWNSE